MSDDANKKLMADFGKAWVKADIDGILACVTEDFEWRQATGTDGPSGRVQIEPKTNHALQNVYLAELKDQSFNIIETHESQPPTDTLLVCDLVADPDQSTFKFENGLEAAGIKL